MNDFECKFMRTIFAFFCHRTVPEEEEEDRRTLFQWQSTTTKVNGISFCLFSNKDKENATGQRINWRFDEGGFACQ